MKKLLFITLSLFCCVNLSAQDIQIWQTGNTKPDVFPVTRIDSLVISPCDTAIYDLSGCDLDIDSAIVSVSCGNLVNVQVAFDGTPSFIKYTIYDTIGAIIFTAFNTSQLTFTLPGLGIYYGVVEASCGGGDKNGGDEDEEAFEIINLAPTADFDLAESFSCVGGTCLRTITTTDNSQEEGILTYSWNVTDLSTGVSSTFNTAQPTYTTIAKNEYKVELTVTNQKGCSAYKTRSVQAVAKCNPKFDWKYSWCDTCKGGNTNMNVSFTNMSQYADCATGLTYSWDFGDGSTSTLETPSHIYSVPCAGQAYTVRLTIQLGLPTDSNYCQSTWDTIITINNKKPAVGVMAICCDGLVSFYTDAVKGKWNTPGSLGIPKWPAVSKKIWKPVGVQVGQNYRQYYPTAGAYSVTVTGAQSEDHNICPIREVRFTIDKVECFNRNVTRKGAASLNGVDIKYKVSALALPLVHRVKSKIKAKGGKKVAEISTEFSGNINREGADGCFCTQQSIYASSGMLTNKRKARAKTSTSGKFRIAEDKIIAKFHVVTKGGTAPSNTGDYELKIGYAPCDHPWFMFF